MELFDNNPIKEIYGVEDVLAQECEQKPENPFEALYKEVSTCKKCRLHETRLNIVFGVGDPAADLMFVGEGPGAEEDKQGIPFVGRAGQLLTKMIEAMGFTRDTVYIANIVKCRPPENRNPFEDESNTCIPYLYRQIEYVKPKVIVCLGSVAAQNFLKTKLGITKIRGEFVELNGVKVMPTYHPAYLLRNPKMKKPCWEDLQKVMAVFSCD
ncbi:phage SPO1 DNA polymerase-related protein [Denitrovibrio acetiphilus DSM 12809]|uniref:Type-4 uracil-DNA glycosylase n=1 Tax=Denitrovibrio acetiphilus (strain DSM 12809 / NBRC 114555 / N2460) TaxID=522772 RepID=D4H8H7_DENA2|nr:uracil-DNA glycosylase [Denitrovibrio acetiphilus]ADD68326.1 phage SPO1 DNA polymerase-related protein [Denitrovibrio acetiphilus DSM 12809]